MRWNKFTILTTSEAEDYISAMLAELGIEGIEIENYVPLTKEETAGMFIDFPPELPPDDGTSRVSFYIEEGQPYAQLLEQVQIGIGQLRSFADVGAGTITADLTEDIDWMNNWKQFFTSFTIDGKILVKPTWEELKEADKDKILIEIDPGISFGTGKHETTQLCIRALCRYMEGMDAPAVLDVGCGSGILSIAALKLGARAVVGTDIDENCMESTRQNMEANHLPMELGTFYVGNLIDDAALVRAVGTNKYDIIVANILADVLIPLSPVIPSLLKENGIFIASGIIDFKEQEVKEAVAAAGMDILEVNAQGEWVSVTARRA